MKDRYPLERWPIQWIEKVVTDFPKLNRETRLFLAKAISIVSRAQGHQLRIDTEVNMPNLDEILKNALSLDIDDRATLAERLLASLEELSEEEADRLWAEEAQRRLKDYRTGRSKAVPAEEIHDKAERLLR